MEGQFRRKREAAWAPAPSSSWTRPPILSLMQHISPRAHREPCADSTLPVQFRAPAGPFCWLRDNQVTSETDNCGKTFIASWQGDMMSFDSNNKKMLYIEMDKQQGSANSLTVQWLGLQASTAGGPGSIPGQETKIPHATRYGQKKKNPTRSYCIAQGTTFNILW